MLILLPPSEKKATEPGPAITVYTGVLYQGLGWATLTKAAQNRAQKSIAIISAKYGSLKCLDPIEPYKEKIDAAHMRGPITKALDAIETDLVIDCRSSTYQSVWSPPFAFSAFTQPLCQLHSCAGAETGAISPRTKRETKARRIRQP